MAIYLKFEQGEEEQMSLSLLKFEEGEFVDIGVENDIDHSIYDLYALTLFHLCSSTDSVVNKEVFLAMENIIKSMNDD